MEILQRAAAEQRDPRFSEFHGCMDLALTGVMLRDYGPRGETLGHVMKPDRSTIAVVEGGKESVNHRVDGCQIAGVRHGWPISPAESNGNGAWSSGHADHTGVLMLLPAC